MIEAPDVVVSITETLPSTQINSVKGDGEITQENYSPSEMVQNLKNQITIFEPDASLSGKRLKANQPRNFSYPKKKFGKEEISFLPSWYNKWTWLHYDEAEDSVYCIICKSTDHCNMLNDIRVENSFIKTWYSNWKHARSTDKYFHQHESSNCHQKAIQRLIEIPKSTEDVSETIKSNLTDVQSQNKACLIKLVSCLHYLSR